jgi:hypothetical protein
MWEERDIDKRFWRAMPSIGYVVNIPVNLSILNCHVANFVMKKRLESLSNSNHSNSSCNQLDNLWFLVLGKLQPFLPFIIYIQMCVRVHVYSSFESSDLNSYHNYRKNHFSLDLQVEIDKKKCYMYVYEYIYIHM